MKKMITTSLALLLCLSSSVVMANDKADKKSYKLTPEAGSEVILQDAELTIDEANSTSKISFKGRAKAGDGVTGYQLTIDRKNKTYKTRKLSKKALDEMNADADAADASASTVEDSSDSVQALATNYYTGWFKITTVDPVRVPVNATKLTLKWKEYTDGTLEDTGHSFSPWAANPSELDTHWFIDDSDDSTPVANSDSSEIYYRGWADYYNYDFGDDSWRTDVSHWIEMTALQEDVGCAGCFDYSYNTDESGESSALLNYNITTSY
ncbi:hypothetical protein EDM52_21590 [Brevibacillus invocatus]|uniref:Uncharacterized protein n=1 Tax=Brevibacillus invocatus TaxID=173959 RepID=A0A3M8BXC4_9BACL|nr:hypothetical protein [Brevibacillus invocatus]RNB68004.1 hypothetical protein EDM52_21590 [Brevibacillus invocatus]